MVTGCLPADDGQGDHTDRAVCCLGPVERYFVRPVTDLALDVDPSMGRRAGLEHALREAIRSGRLPPGTALPSTRSLAIDRGLARATVVTAYEHLAAEGYLVTRPGAGTRVADLRLPTVSPAHRPPTTPRYRVDFRPGEPDGSLFPRAAWVRSVRQVLGRATDQLFSYGDQQGHPELRVQLAEYLARSRAMFAPPEAISIFGGLSSAFGFLAEMLRRVGTDRVAIEDPSLFILRDILALAGVQLFPVPVDTDGIDVGALDRLDVGAVIVTPAHQYPLGHTMAPHRRVQLLDWARRRDAWIVEDDYDGEFRYDRQPVGALQGLDPDRVIYAGSASKSLAPALRIAWLALPGALTGPMAAVKHWRGGVSGLEQATLADFIARGELDRHLRHARTLYRRRHHGALGAARGRGSLARGTPHPGRAAPHRHHHHRRRRTRRRTPRRRRLHRPPRAPTPLAGHSDDGGARPGLQPNRPTPLPHRPRPAHRPPPALLAVGRVSRQAVSMGSIVWDRELAEVYDAVYAASFDDAVLEPIVDVLENLTRGGQVLEFATGTGRVALPLHARGVAVHGIELSPHMVEQLRAKPDAADIGVTVGDMTTTRVPGSFTLVFLVANTIMNVTTQEDQLAVFANASAHLEQGGLFVVEVIVPRLRSVPEGEMGRVFTLDADHVGVETFDDLVGQIAWSHHWMEVAGRFVQHSAPYRYVWPSELDLMARLAGFRLRDRWSGWDQAPFTSASTSQVAVFEKVA